MVSTERIEVVLPGTVEPEGLQLRRGPLPVPGAGQVLVAVDATGVSFAEQQMRRGRYFDQPPFPFVLGYDLVGKLVDTGAGLDPARVGARVAALTKVGGWASHVVLDVADVVDVPAGVGSAEAETVVVNGITARQMLHRVWLWNLLPNGRHAYFFNIWAGRKFDKAGFRTRLRQDLTAVFGALDSGQIAAELPLERIADALRLAESGTVAGKVVLKP